MTNLSGKTALITGAGQGIGRGVALAMAGAGASVALFGRTLSKLEETSALASAQGSECLTVAGDVCDGANLERFVREATDRFGSVDVLVNNAQEVPLGRLEDVSDHAFTRGFESGPLASLRLMKHVRPLMAQAGGGTIFNFCSSAGIRWDMSGYGAYGAVKQATRALTRAAAAEWGRDGIRVLTIAPHARSPGLEAWIEGSPEEAEAFVRTIPLGRIGHPEEDIGRALVALCGTDLSYLTGATVPLDGGQANFD